MALVPGEDPATAHDHTVSMNVSIHVLVVLLSHCDTVPKTQCFCVS